MNDKTRDLVAFLAMVVMCLFCLGTASYASERGDIIAVIFFSVMSVGTGYLAYLLKGNLTGDLINAKHVDKHSTRDTVASSRIYASY